VWIWRRVFLEAGVHLRVHHLEGGHSFV
jgi:hypothetical protein